MPTRPKPPGPSETVNRIAAKLAEQEEPPSDDVDAAWEWWMAGVQRVDERAKTLLRAAFEAGRGRE